MAHPIIEALYIGLLTGGLSQPVDTPQPVMSQPTETAVVEMPVRRRVVYDWANGERVVFRHDASSRVLGEQPVVGMTDAQVDRINRAAAS